MHVTTELKVRALKREIAMRKAVYPARVRRGDMRPSEAEREIAVMEAILADYEPRAPQREVA